MALLLTRKIGQSIKIGRSIVVEVTAVRRGRVSLRVAAPPDVPILRGELQFFTVPIAGDPATANTGTIHG